MYLPSSVTANPDGAAGGDGVAVGVAVGAGVGAVVGVPVGVAVGPPGVAVGVTVAEVAVAVGVGVFVGTRGGVGCGVTVRLFCTIRTANWLPVVGMVDESSTGSRFWNVPMMYL